MLELYGSSKKEKPQRKVEPSPSSSHSSPSITNSPPFKKKVALAYVHRLNYNYCLVEIVFIIFARGLMSKMENTCLLLLCLPNLVNMISSCCPWKMLVYRSFTQFTVNFFLYSFKVDKCSTTSSLYHIYTITWC